MELPVVTRNREAGAGSVKVGSVGDREGYRQVVERRPQVVDGIGGDPSDLQRDWGTDDYEPFFASAVRVGLGPNSYRSGIAVGAGFALHPLQFMTAPPDL